MKKLVQGILDFQRKTLPSYRETFAKLALGQKPDALYIGCSDSRVAINVFASTDPGDLFVNRNVGNIIPPCRHDVDPGNAVLATIEFAVLNLNVKNVIVCGHSECGAMMALLGGIEKIKPEGLRSWLSHAKEILPHLEAQDEFASELSPHNRLSQLNVLKQIEHLKSYPMIYERLQAGTLNIHGWWFEISKAQVHAYDPSQKRFIPIDENEGERILKRIG